MKRLINKKTGEVAIVDLYLNTITFSKSKTTHKITIKKDSSTHKITKIITSSEPISDSAPQPTPIKSSNPKPIKKQKTNNKIIKSKKPINTPNIKSTHTPKKSKFISLPNSLTPNIILKSPFHPKTPLKTPSSTYKKTA